MSYATAPRPIAYSGYGAYGADTSSSGTFGKLVLLAAAGAFLWWVLDDKQRLSFGRAGDDEPSDEELREMALEDARRQAGHVLDPKAFDWEKWADRMAQNAESAGLLRTDNARSLARRARNYRISRQQAERLANMVLKAA